MSKLLKGYQVGDWCKRAAWFIAAIGVIYIVINIVSGIFSIRQQIASDPTTVVWYAVLAQVINPAVSILFTTVFYFFVLYAAGTIVNRLFAYTAVNETNGKVSGTMLAWREDTAIKPSAADTSQKASDVVLGKIEDTTPQSISAESDAEESDVTQDKVEDTAPQSTAAEAAEEQGDVTLHEVEDTAIESITAESDAGESNVTLAEEKATVIEHTMAESNERKSDVRLPRRRSRK